MIALLKPLADGIRASLKAMRQGREGDAADIPRTERDTPINYVLIGCIALALPLFAVFVFVVDQKECFVGFKPDRLAEIIGS